MSKAKDIARAKAGDSHFNAHSPRTHRRFICANCHGGGGTLVKVGDYRFHTGCPKRMVPIKVGEKL